MRFFVAAALLVLISCAEVSEKEKTLRVRNTLRQRYLSGDTLPFPGQKLLACLPAALPGWTALREDKSLFTAAHPDFSSAARTFVRNGNQVLILQVADYAADSAAYAHLFSQLSTAGATDISLPDSLQPETLTFRKDTQSSLSELNLLMKGRFHLSVQSNTPENAAELGRALQQVRWAELETLQP
ncbi:MAG: hypothetical protein EAZ89_08235 [Bacteroidetes bacterium]|nr:MAG: hypothetical protein EAZ89_08235 [Bacteroidota bacterium]